VAPGPVLVAGGARDPNLETLLAALSARRIPVQPALIEPARSPWVAWNLAADQLVLDGVALAPSAVFLRHDVFSPLMDPRPEVGFRSAAWAAALTGWVLAHPRVRCPNRNALICATNKVHALVRALANGLPIPLTAVTNHAGEAERFLPGQPKIAKPIGGGDLCRPLDPVLQRSQRRGEVLAAPAIVQERLIPPEVRVYGVGGRLFAFEVRSEELDYRAGPVEVLYLGAPPPEIAGGVRRLMDELRLDFAAADFKTSGDGAGLLFLEINNAPMFTRFDMACSGALSAALCDWLLAGGPDS
jgi:hypothetical protein